MPKEIFVDPASLATPAALATPDIPVRRYDRPFAAERERYGDDALAGMLRHMLIVREFETMLANLKARGEHAGTPITYRGPAHLSIGQEAAAVGLAWGLHPQDHLFGSHRSHGEFIAKSLVAIEQMPADSLGEIMDTHAKATLRSTVEAHLPGDGPRNTAERFMLFGLLAEIFMRANGFNKGMGGSMHAFFPPFGAYPNNAIVGASSAIAAGAALRMRQARTGIAVSSVGDGASGCGLVHEAMNFASMAQFETLWSDRCGYPPVLFVFHNNFYAMGGQTIGETMAYERLSRIGAGVRADALNAETVDGANLLAVADAVSRKRAILADGRGPALLDIECYRSAGHSTSDASAYRTREELAAWNDHDPIARHAALLAEAGIVSGQAFQGMQAEVAALVADVTRAAADPAIAPPVDLAGDPMLIGRQMFTASAQPPEVTQSWRSYASATSRVRQHTRKARRAHDESGEPLSPMRMITMRDALFEVILEHMASDDRLIAYGEECREWGGAFGVYRGLSDLFPHDRLFNAPISEAAIVSTAVGYAIEGGRALVELMYTDFIGRAGDEIFNQLAKWQAMSAGMIRLPVVVRCSVGSKYGAQHSQDWTSLVAHIPGLKVAYPATPYDAKGLMATALAGDDPVIFFESQRLYDIGEQFAADGVPEAYYQVPFGAPDLKRAGTDLTILTIGPSLYPAIEAAGMLAERYGLAAEIIATRTLVPFKYEPVVASVQKTGRLLIVSEACERGSFAMTLATNVSQLAFQSLKVPVRALGAPNWIVPGAEMEAFYFPGSADIVDAAASLFPDLAHAAGGSRIHDIQAQALLGL